MRFTLTIISLMVTLCSLWAESNLHYTPVAPELYGQNAIMICKVMNGASEMRNVEVSAWTKGTNPECRGTSRYYYLNCIQLVIYGDHKTPMEWHIWDHDTQTEMIIDDGYQYSVNKESGTNIQPYLIYWSNTVTGDVNGDGIVNIADITELIAYLKGSPTSHFNTSAADINGDKQITIDDIPPLRTLCLQK